MGYMNWLKALGIVLLIVAAIAGIACMIEYTPLLFVVVSIAGIFCMSVVFVKKTMLD